MRKMTFDEYRRLLLEMLKNVDEICTRYNLNYMIAFGSLIGTIRHGGYIPWDDDIDIVMPREDYNKLLKIINASEGTLNFIDISCNKNTIFSYGKICKKGTKVIESNFRNVDGYGAFIDVFPIDNAPNNAFIRKYESHKIVMKRRQLQHATKNKETFTSNIRTNILRLLAFAMTRKVNPERKIQEINYICQKYNNISSDYIWIQGMSIAPKEWYKNCVRKRFEDIEVWIPKEYDLILKSLYGNYMELPPESERTIHGIDCYII